VIPLIQTQVSSTDKHQGVEKSSKHIPYPIDLEIYFDGGGFDYHPSACEFKWVS
jgi:hypothetical protein